jgi:hypothetical protein
MFVRYRTVCHDHIKHGREGSPSRLIEMDEVDAIQALGKIRLIAVEDTVGDILIEVSKS